MHAMGVTVSVYTRLGGKVSQVLKGTQQLGTRFERKVRPKDKLERVMCLLPGGLKQEGGLLSSHRARASS